jgi:hypothetical protein
VSIVDRRLLAVVERLALPDRAAYRRFIPAALTRPFTTAEFSAAAKLPARLGQQTVYCLRGMGLLQSVGTRGRSILYEEIP